MLSLIDLEYENYNELVFSRVSFSLLSGGIFILKGPNGSGKTTLLKILAGIIKSTKGQLLWDNKATDKLDYSSLVAYLGHKNALKSGLTVLENLEFWAKIRNRSLLIEPALAHFGLTFLVDEKYGNLSSGWQKRVALARLILSDAKIWLLDEPEANLDNKAIELLLQLLQVKISSGGIAIIASHNQEYYSKIPVININDFKK